MAIEMLRMQNITKVYPNGFVANTDVSFSVDQGEIHALIGENGAGKTTLMKILFGMEDCQTGKIFIQGEESRFSSPLDAIAKGVGMVHQHFMLVPSLTVAENAVMGIEPLKNGIFDFEEAVRMTQAIADKYNFTIDVRAKIKDISVGRKQIVEILKVLIRGGKVLIMDEPTAVLTPQETDELFEQLKMLKEDGHSIIFISHKLEEVMRLCDRVTVLRRGKVVGSGDVSELDEVKLSRMMVGRDVILKIDKPLSEPDNILVEVKNLTHRSREGVLQLDNVTFNLRAGEVLGIAGVEGNGQSELCDVIAGISSYEGGSVSINGQTTMGMTVNQIRETGLAMIPEDRMKTGCSVDLSVKDNIMANRIFSKEFRKGLFLNRKKINTLVDRYIEKFQIACNNRNQLVRYLSGGNIQKVVVARELTSGANVIIANQPTRGIDVNTTEMIRKLLIEMTRENDMGVILVSADLNEILEVSDRLMVMWKGQIVAIFPQADEVDEETLGEYMLGLKRMPVEELEALI
ncbi:MAG: ABC transporter ATP-binding protein [Clostridiaceae bacterium]|nr:ABC transporter ATP-binding protein [Clostridiaceae bacterium]